ncbi:MAG TPA: hypothetical protein VGT05_02625 [Patescibacteria group bacterium]|nr:hypothetical protein [Patescibacteria group bacterium]
MAKTFLTEKLHRIVGQVKFRPTIKTFDSTASLAAGVEDKFEEWAAQKHEDIALYSPSEKKILQITFDTITYLNEGKNDTKELYDYISKIFTKSTKELGVNQIRRLEVRHTQVLEASFEFNELVELIYKKFYAQNEDVKNISADTPRDSVFVLDGSKNGFLNHVQIGPVKKDQGIKAFNSSYPDNKTDIKDSNLFIDVSIFIEGGLTAENTLEKLDKAIKENLRVTKDYLGYIQTL